MSNTRLHAGSHTSISHICAVQVLSPAKACCFQESLIAKDKYQLTQREKGQATEDPAESVSRENPHEALSTLKRSSFITV